MPNYHLSPELGPRICKAEKGECRFGSDALHFDNLEVAQDTYEKQLEKQHTVMPTGIKSEAKVSEMESKLKYFQDKFLSPDAKYTAKDLRELREYAALHDAHSAKLQKCVDSTSQTGHTSTTEQLKDTQRSHNLERRHLEMIPDSQSSNVVPFPRNNFLTIRHHSKLDRVTEVMANSTNRPLHRLTTRNVGYMMNPSDVADFTKSDYSGLSKKRIIAGNADGSRCRVILVDSDSPKADLGVNYTQYKTSGTRNRPLMSVTSELKVLGFVDENGVSFGYVPDKKLPFFIETESE